MLRLVSRASSYSDYAALVGGSRAWICHSARIVNRSRVFTSVVVSVRRPPACDCERVIVDTLDSISEQLVVMILERKTPARKNVCVIRESVADGRA